MLTNALKLGELGHRKKRKTEMTVSPEAIERVHSEEDWDHGTNWRGLGLTDPIKKVEVCSP